MTPTETLAKLLEESGAQIVLPKEEIRKAFAALQDEVARLTQERDTAQEQHRISMDINDALLAVESEALALIRKTTGRGDFHNIVEAVQHLVSERDAALAKAAEFDNIEDFPAELQVKCATFTEAAHPVDCISIGKELYADLRADRERLEDLARMVSSGLCVILAKSDDNAPFIVRRGLTTTRKDHLHGGDTLRAAIDAARKAGA